MLRAIDLFCGAGGMSLGFKRAGFSVLLAVDSDAIHAATYQANFPDVDVAVFDLFATTGTKLRDRAGVGSTKIDVIFGGPPCQGFSEGGRRSVRDVRNAGLWHFGRLVTEIRPRMFVVENVTGLLSPRNQSPRKRFGRLVRSAGYKMVPAEVLDAQQFGVPQRRKRVFIIGYLPDEVPQEPRYPEPFESEPPTAWDAIGDLATLERSTSLHDHDAYSGPVGPASAYAAVLRVDSTSRRVANLTGCRRSHHDDAVAKRFSDTLPGVSEPVSRFIRLHPSKVSPTLRAGTGERHARFTAPRPIHPSFPRCITVREGARIHSFPDWFGFDERIWHGFRQVGNSVPPLLAECVAREIATALRPATARERLKISQIGRMDGASISPVRATARP